MTASTSSLRAGNQRVIIVGGGVIGSAVAYYLCKAGVSCTILERDTIGAHASSVAAGLITPLSEAKNPVPLLDLKMKSLGMYPDVACALREESGVDIGYTTVPVLRLASDEQEAQFLQETVKWQLSNKLKVDWLSAKEVRNREPELAANITGGILTEFESQVDTQPLTIAFARAASRMGCIIKQGVSVTSVNVTSSEVLLQTSDGAEMCDKVILATGPWVDLFQNVAIAKPPVKPVKGEIIRAYMPEHAPRNVLFHGKYYMAPKPDGAVVIGATEADHGFDEKPTVGGVEEVFRNTIAFYPHAARATIAYVSAGLRPVSVDTMPILGPVEKSGRVVATVGHGRSGLILAPVTGQMIADYVCSGNITSGMKAFSIDRFS